MKGITVQELKNRISENRNTEILIDVRTEAEYNESHIVNARNIPLQEIKEAIESLRTFKTVFVQCRSGGRSAQACDTLVRAGIPAVNVEGGIIAWESAGFPTSSEVM